MVPAPCIGRSIAASPGQMVVVLNESPLLKLLSRGSDRDLHRKYTHSLELWDASQRVARSAVQIYPIKRTCRSYQRDHY